MALCDTGSVRKSPTLAELPGQSFSSTRSRSGHTLGASSSASTLVGASETITDVFLPSNGFLRVLMRGIISLVVGRLRGHPEFESFVRELSDVRAAQSARIEVVQLMLHVMTFWRICSQVCVRTVWSRGRKCIGAASPKALSQDF